MTPTKNDLPRSLPFGLALITSATLLLEIGLTRIFSITMWYHFAFMAISIALFGMAFGAVLVYLRPEWFPEEKIFRRLGQLGLLFSLSTALCFWLHLQIPFSPVFNAAGIVSVVLSFLLTTIPFLFSGVLVSLILTRFPRHVGRLYAYDLIGAAVGCLLLWALVRPLTGPGIVIASAVLAAAGALFFLWNEKGKRIKAFSGGVLAVLTVLMLLQPSTRLFEIKWVKNTVGAPVAQRVPEAPVIERWNSHAVVTVFRYVLEDAFAWGMSPVFRPDSKTQQLMLTIDAAAGTIITKYTGKSHEIRHLKYDVTSLAHHLRPESEALVIGTGGGRDILTALSFNARRVTGVEINRDILKLINVEMADFTGHLADNPKVRFQNDEARNWIERSGERFDIIQASLIDSWAATSAGAFVLTENSLYTAEAWTEFLNHLTDKGVLTMSRWWMKDRPGEMIRCTSIAYAALKNLGVKDPRAHVMIATTDYERFEDAPNGVGTILVSRRPFSPEDIRSFNEICEQFQFKVLLTPEEAAIPEFADILDLVKHDAVVAAYPLNVAPPTDDDPFFFNMLRLSDIFRSGELDQFMTSFNVKAVTILVTLFGLVVLLSVFGLLLPVWLHERNRRKAGGEALSAPALFRHSLYFAGIGLGFILVEIGQMQRLTLFLGHPVYSLVVVLFSLLLATGIGSALAGRLVLRSEDGGRRAMLAVGAILAVTLFAALGLPLLLRFFHGVSLPPRILFSVAVLFAMGVPMGMAFPVGLKYADREVRSATPWLWAINGGLSVIGSVLAMILSIAFGITATCLVGALCYALPLLALSRNRRAA